MEQLESLMSLAVLLATVAAAVGLWLFLQRRTGQSWQNTLAEKERRSLRQTTADLIPSVEMADKRHTVKMAVLRAELAVSSEAHALECALRLARHSMTHEDWLAGLSPQERELYSESAALLEAATGPATASPLPVGTHPKFRAPERSGDDWIDLQIEEGFRRQVARRQQLFESTAGSLQAEPKLLPYVKEALKTLGREDLWAQVS